MIDFFIGGYEWGVELTRDGSGLKEHYGRFLPGGKYHN